MALLMKAIAIFTLASAVTASCAHGTSLSRREEGKVPVATFGYHGDIGPINWTNMNSTANKLCSTGKNQSPVDAMSGHSHVVPGTGFELNIPAVQQAVLENLGSTVEVIINGTFTHGGQTYTIRQFHFHTPSEHRIDHEYHPMEVHFVSQSKSTGELSVAGFPIALGAANPLFTSVFANLADIETPGTLSQTPPLDFSSLAAHLKSHKVFRYEGSLTTPPCTEGVQWVFSMTPQTIDDATYNAAKRVMGYNSRYLQNSLGTTNVLSLASSDACQNGTATPVTSPIFREHTNDSTTVPQSSGSNHTTTANQTATATRRLVVSTGASPSGPVLSMLGWCLPAIALLLMST